MRDTHATTALPSNISIIGGSKHSWTHRAALPGGDLGGDFATFLDEVRRRWSFLPDTLAERLARAYGTRVGYILEKAGRMGDLGENFGGGLTAAEVRYLQAHERAITAEDILWRRTKLGLHLTERERANVEQYLGAAPRAVATGRGV